MGSCCWAFPQWQQRILLQIEVSCAGAQSEFSDPYEQQSHMADSAWFKPQQPQQCFCRQSPHRTTNKFQFVKLESETIRVSVLKCGSISCDTANVTSFVDLKQRTGQLSEVARRSQESLWDLFSSVFWGEMMRWKRGHCWTRKPIFLQLKKIFFKGDWLGFLEQLSIDLCAILNMFTTFFWTK